MARTTVVIASHNRVDSLLRSLTHLSELAAPVILVDNASADETVARVRQDFPQVTVLESEVNLGAAARNLGVRLARTPFVAFADDDSVAVVGSRRGGMGALLRRGRGGAPSSGCAAGAGW
ncbi:glycosyltransferase family 2 protein [Lentzea sp. NPDC054927]